MSINSGHASAGPRSLVRSLLGIIPAAAVLMFGGSANAAKPEIDESYANGQIVWMIGPRMIVDAASTQPHLYATSEELYLMVYPLNGTPQNPLSNTAPQTLPSGYQPQCNPCYHPGLPAPFVYHDHLLVGAPGMGKNGTALANKGPWKIILLMYSPSVVNDPNFKPITNAADIPAAEALNEFLPINPGPGNAFEVDTGNVLICPLVSPNA